MSRLGGVEQRHRDPARVEGAKEGNEVVQVLRAQDGDAVTGLRDLLQTGTHGAVTGAEVGPHDVALNTVTLGGVVDESIGQLVATNLRPLLNVTNQVRIFRELDSSVHDERVVVSHCSPLLLRPSPVSYADGAGVGLADGFPCARALHDAFRAGRASLYPIGSNHQILMPLNFLLMLR